MDAQSIESIQTAVNSLCNVQSSPRALQDVAVFLLTQCHNMDPDFIEKQNCAAKLGAVDALIRVILSCPDELTRMLCFQALGVMAFNNPQVSLQIGSNDVFLRHIEILFYDDSISSQYKEEALYPIKNAAGVVWDIHPSLLRLVPPIASLMSQLPEGLIRSQFSSFLCVLAYNPACRDTLLDAGLVPVMSSLLTQEKTPAGFPLSAAISLACLLGHEKDHHALDACNSDAVVMHLINALSNAMHGEDYPENSGTYYVDWKVMMGISLLCLHPSRLERFRSRGILSAIEDALTRSSSDKLVKHATTVLWLLTSPS